VTAESISKKVEEASLTDSYLQGDEYYGRAESFYDRANYADAIRNFEKAAEYFKKSGNTIKLMETLSGKGMALDSLGRYNEHKYHEAISCFDEVIMICKDDPRLRTPYAMALHMKGYSLGNLRKYDEAIECLEEAIDPLDDMENLDHTIYADILRNKAYAYAMRRYSFENPPEDDWKKAIEYLECAEKIDSEFAYLWNTHGYINLIYKRKRCDKIL
jgi:tetratricopeptide (TPR) repeat protein